MTPSPSRSKPSSTSSLQLLSTASHSSLASGLMVGSLSSQSPASTLNPSRSLSPTAATPVACSATSVRFSPQSKRSTALLMPSSVGLNSMNTKRAEASGTSMGKSTSTRKGVPASRSKTTVVGPLPLLVISRRASPVVPSSISPKLMELGSTVICASPPQPHSTNRLAISQRATVPVGAGRIDACRSLCDMVFSERMSSCRCGSCGWFSCLTWWLESFCCFALCEGCNSLQDRDGL